MSFDLVKTFKVTDDTHTLGIASGVDGASGFTATAPTFLCQTASSVGKTISPIALRMFLVGTAPAAETAIYIVGDEKVRYVSGGAAATIRSPVFSFEGADTPDPDTDVKFYTSKNGSTITVNSSTSAELIDTVTLVGGTPGVGFTYEFKESVSIEKGCSLLVYVCAAGATPKMKMSFWYRQEK